MHDGEFSWNAEIRDGFAGGFSHSPIDFHDPSQIAGTPFFDDDRFIIKFNCFWTIEIRCCSRIRLIARTCRSRRSPAHPFRRIFRYALA